MNTLRNNPNIKNWTPSSWKNFKISQQPVYPDSERVNSITNKLSSLPPIVNYNEIIDLKSKLSQCHEDKSFIIQVGDCAERFADATEEVIQRKIIFFNVLSHILAYHLKKEVIIIGRIAGQYAKPRSSNFEMINNEKVEVFRGEIVNDISSENRVAEPTRMLEAYYHSISTVSQIKDWNNYGDKSIKNFKKMYTNNTYQVNSDKFIKKLMEYYDTFPMPESDSNISYIEKSNVYSSHEGLLLNYEECFVRKIENVFYDLSAHFLWIGERTGRIDEAHVEFFRGVANPIGIKTSSRTNFEDLIKMIQILNPGNHKGKIVIITRFGCEITETCLDSLCLKIKQSDLNVIFVCDPNHGNTKVDDESKRKVRYFEDLKNEIVTTHNILKKHGLFLSGIHLEASSFPITECLGGLDNAITEILDEYYTTYCDPRLNNLQTMELCDFVGEFMSLPSNNRMLEEEIFESINKNV